MARRRRSLTLRATRPMWPTGSRPLRERWRSRRRTHQGSSNEARWCVRRRPPAGNPGLISSYSGTAVHPKPVPTIRTLFKATFCAALLAVVSTPGSSQGIFGGIAKRVSDAASQKAQDKVNGKIDEMTQKMVDNSFDAMFGGSAKPAPAPASGGTAAASAPAASSSAGAAPNANAGGSATGGASANASPFWNNSDAKTESSYTFNVVTTMEIASSRNAGDKTVFKMHYNTNEPYSGTLIVP